LYIGGLTESLERAREEVELRRSEADEARRKLNTLERDRDRLDQQVADLGKQVIVLVREVEAARAGVPSSSVNPPAAIDTSSTEAVLETRLLTFRDIAELQQRNIELLAVVRELSANRDQTEANLVEEKTAEVRHELDTALR
jgi:nucleoprotein TPR